MNRLILLSIPLMMASCKNNGGESAAQPEGKPGMAVSQDNPYPEDPLVPTTPPDTFRVVISLISIGEGTDPEGPAKVERFLNDWQKQTGKTLTYTVQPWGREGETDYNFTLAELPVPQQADFVKQLESAMKDEKLIRVVENKANRFKR